jgi:pimeloyl-ACP methyl ester carboxylesterase
LVGYAEGARVAADLARQEPSFFARVALVNGDPASLTPSAIKIFGERGGKREIGEQRCDPGIMRCDFRYSVHCPRPIVVAFRRGVSHRSTFHAVLSRSCVRSVPTGDPIMSGPVTLESLDLAALL